MSDADSTCSSSSYRTAPESRRSSMGDDFATAPLSLKSSDKLSTAQSLSLGDSSIEDSAQQTVKPRTKTARKRKRKAAALASQAMEGVNTNIPKTSNENTLPESRRDSVVSSASAVVTKMPKPVERTSIVAANSTMEPIEGSKPTVTEATTVTCSDSKHFVIPKQTEDDYEAFMAKLKMQQVQPVLDIIRKPDSIAGQSDIEHFLGHLANPDLNPTQKANLCANASLGIFFLDAGTREIPGPHMKKEIRAFVAAMLRSPAKRNITHLDIGWKKLLPSLPHIKRPNNLDAHITGQSDLLYQMSLFSRPVKTSKAVQNQHNRALLVRMVRWVAMALPHIRTMTFHDDANFLHCHSHEEYLEDLMAPFVELEEVSIVCEKPFVAISFRVEEGERWNHRIDSQAETSLRLKGREYYADRK